jgi:hypothetical protein
VTEHYKWFPRQQQWKPAGAEVAMIVGVTGLFVALISLALVLLR